MSQSIATLVWQVASKENLLDKVQDEIHQVTWLIGMVQWIGYA
jgi:hypothetical protein